jgi:hypothetical protein
MLSLQNKTFPLPSPPADYTGYESDEPTPAQRARWAVADAALAERRNMGIVDGRDWTGVLVEHQTNCRCNGCVPEVPADPRESEDYLRCQSLFGTDQAEFMIQSRAGMSWYDIFFPGGYDPEWDAMMVAYTATKAEREAESERTIAAFRQKLIEEKVATEARRNLKRGDAVEKKACPCARLYSCVGDKSTGGAKPTTRHVSSECWSHERVCPQTGKLLTPHKCPWLHPGEPGWQKQWQTDRMWKAPTPAPAPTRTWEPENRFTAVRRNDGWETAKRR